MIIHNASITGSFSVNGTNVASITSSQASIDALNTFSSSILSFTASTNTFTASAATTGSNTFVGNQVVSGSLTIFTGSAIEFQVTNTGVRLGNAITDTHNVTGSLNVSGSITTPGTLTAQTLVVQTITSSVDFVTGSTRFGSLSSNTHVFTGSVGITGSLNIGGNVNLNNNNGILYWNNTGGGTLYGYIQGSSGLMNIQASASGDINFGNGVDLVRIKGSGNVGIGTNSPLGSLTERTLHLSDGGAGYTTLYVTNGTNTLRGIFAVANPTSTILIGTQTNTDLRIVTNDTTRMFVSSSGNVGIGNTIPFSPLHINSNGAFSTSGNMTSGIIVSNTNAGRALNMGVFDTGSYAYMQAAYVNNANVTFNLALQPQGGNVGIGTTTPTGTLTVANASALCVFKSTTTTNYAEVQIENTTNYLQIGVEGGSGNRMGGTIAYNAYLGSYNNYGMTFHTNNLNRITITNGGNVLIGTNSDLGLSAGGILQVNNAFGMSITNGGQALRFIRSGVNTFQIGQGSVTSQTGFIIADVTAGTNPFFLQQTTGFLGVGTTAPNHRLDVNGNINIPGGNQLVFNNEATVWAIVARTTTSTTNLGAALKNMIYCGGGANEGLAVLGSGYNAALEVRNDGNVWVRGTLTKGGGSFRIDHPLPEKKDTHYLYHSFIEGPKADLIYRGKIHLVNGTATVNIDEVSTMTEGTFELLTRDAQCFVNNLSGWDLVKGNITGNILTITSQNPNSTDEISWMVVAERNDEWFRTSEMTDEDGNTIVEKLKPIIE